MEPIYIIRKPLLTEKSTTAMNEFGHYTFDVDRRASKTDIKDAVEKAYGVKVVGVQTITQKGKTRRLKYGYVKGATTKKAVVRLKEGQVIELF